MPFNEITYILFNKEALHIAVENENIEIIRLLLLKPNLDVNKILIKQSENFHTIQN